VSHCLVKGPNNKYAIWSSVVDNFLLIDATLEEAIDFEINDPIYDILAYPGGAEGLERDTRRGAANIEAKGRSWYWAPTLEEAVKTIIAIHGKSESLQMLRECGWLEASK